MSRDFVIPTLAEYFCSPPLTDEDEIRTLINVEDRVEAGQFTEEDTGPMDPSSWTETLFSQWGFSKFRYHNTQKEWYEYDS